MLYQRMPIERESPEEIGYGSIEFNLAESSVTDLKFEELNLQLDQLKLEYIAHRGSASLRNKITENTNLKENHVLVTNGAAGALFIINTSLLDAKDHLIVVKPNYATNIEVPKTIGCAITYVDLKFENEWRINISVIEKAIQSNTKLISITSPHNPTGMLMTEEELNSLVALAESKNIYLLVDETYRNTCFKTPYPIVATKSKKVISVSSLSKAYGLPGLRIGWLISQEEDLMERFLAAKEMIYISNSALDEEVAYQFLIQKEKFESKINERSLENYKHLCSWIEQEKRLECILPKGGVVSFPRFKNANAIDLDKFYSTLLQKYKTMVGPGHWFAMPDSYFRLGFGWVDSIIFKEGLENLSKAMSESYR